jgi:hypothetical protein
LHIGPGDLAFNGAASIIIVVAVISGLRLIIVIIGIVTFTLTSVDLSLCYNSWTDAFDRGVDST